MTVRLLLAAVLAALAFPGGASAGVQSLVFESAPIQVDRYGVTQDVQLVPSPSTDGYVVGMKANVVDLRGNPVPDTDVMLHHVVFVKLGVPDSTCSSFIGYDGKSSPAITQRFYAEGEEHFSLQLPDGYGYSNRATDQWGLLYMLMNHHARPSTVRARDTLRITATYDDSRPHVRVMGIAIVYFAPRPETSCGSFFSPLPVPTQPEQVTVVLLKQPRGTMRHVRSTWVGDYAFGAERVTIPRGTVFTWRFVGGVAHDVTVASGPVGVASPSLRGGRTWSFHFTKPGTYRIFCSLHPALM